MRSSWWIGGAILFLSGGLVACADHVVKSTAGTVHKKHATAAPGRTIFISVTGVDYVFRPMVLRVKVGAKITWINQTTAEHTATSNKSGDFDLDVGAGAAVAIVSHVPGQYAYYCRFHPYMRGVIDIEP